jgi:hypothetical protein
MFEASSSLVPASILLYGRTHIARAMGTLGDDRSPIRPGLQFGNSRTRAFQAMVGLCCDSQAIPSTMLYLISTISKVMFSSSPDMFN